MTCEQAKRFVETWQDVGTAADDEYAAFETHLRGCSSCERSYASIAPLIGRDSGRLGRWEYVLDRPNEVLTRKVMERITSESRTIPSRFGKGSGSRTIRFAAVAAAAMVIVLSGFLARAVWSGRTEGEVVVHFVLDAPGAQRVSLAGSFNGWDPEKLPLRRDNGTSRWEISVPLKRGETYLYNFVVNGKTWIPDPTTEVQVSDGFGGESSLIQL